MIRWLPALALTLLTACPADECSEATDNRCEGNVAVTCEGTIDNAGPTSLNRLPCPQETLCTVPERGRPACLVAPLAACSGDRVLGTEPSCLNDDLLTVCVPMDDAFFLEGQSCGFFTPGSRCGQGPSGATCLAPGDGGLSDAGLAPDR